MIDLSGSAFYSEPNPASIGNPTDPTIQMQQDSATFASDSGELPQTITPQYSRYNDSGQDTFAPSSETTDATFEPANQLPQPTGFQLQPWMLLAAGALLVLYMRSDHE